jgi:hypothetical protein
MTAQESLREISKLRLRFQMNNRLRLESLAALSKIFREHGEDLKDEVLSTLVFALPSELPGERAGESDSVYEAAAYGTVLDIEARGGGHPPPGPGHHPPPGRPGQPPPGPGQPPPGPGQPPPGPGQPPPGPGQPPPGPGQPPPGPGQPPPGPGQPPPRPGQPPPPGKPRAEKGWTLSRGSKKSTARAQKAKAS